MKKKVLSLFVTFAMLFSMLPATALAAGETVAKIGETTYETFSDAMTAANAMTGNVVVDIYGAVEFVNGMELKGSYDSITFNKGADGASITINQTAGGDYLEAHGKTVVFNDLTLAKANPAWANNSGHMGNYFSIQGGTVTYNRCVFPDGACTSNGTATYYDCNLNNENGEYSLWVYSQATVTVDSCDVLGTKGIKMYCEGGANPANHPGTVTIKNTTFSNSITAKAAVAATYGEKLVLDGNIYNNSTPHIELNTTTDSGSNGIIIEAKDGAGNDITSTLTCTPNGTPTTESSLGVLVTDSEGVTRIYTTVAEAVNDAESGDTITLLHDSDEDVDLPAGVQLDKNNHNADNVTETVPVAYIDANANGMQDNGEQSYTSLNAAFSDATSGQTIMLLDDATPSLTSQRAITEASVIDLGGNTLTLKEDDLYFGTTTFKNGTIVVDPSVVASTAVFWMFQGQTLIFDNIEIVATGVSGTYLIGTNGGTGANITLQNGTKITIDNDAAANLTAVIAGNSANDKVVIENSTINVSKITGRLALGGNYSVSGTTVINADGVKEGFYIRAGETLEIKDTASVSVTLNPDPEGKSRYGINLADPSAIYTKADTATVNANNNREIAKIGNVTYASVEAALAAAKDGDTVELISGNSIISMAGSVVDNKTVTITGTATVDWTKGNLFIGRSGEGNGKVIFDGANITSSVKENPASTGIHVSGGKSGDNETNYGTLEIKDSNIELDYLINRNSVTVDGNSTLTVYGGCYTHGRAASESTSGTDETATLTIGAGSTVTVVNENGMGVGGEGNGVMTVNGTYNANVLNVSSKGTVNIGGAVNIDGNVKNDGSIKLTETGATLTSGSEAQNVTSGVEGYEAVEASGTWTVQPKVYTITFDSNGGSDVSSVTYAFGATIGELPVPTRSGYRFDGWGTVPATMPAENLTLTAQWTRISSGGGGGGGGSTSYTITVEDTKNGDITVSPSRAPSGSTVTVSVDPDKGYVLETLSVLDKNGKEIDLTKKADNKYTFKMPSGKVTVEATFMEDNTMLNYFVDVFAGDYYYDAVLWAVENGITNGTSATTFSPSNPCTRAQMATFLWRAAGSPEPSGNANPFVDVPADAYYAKAVQWAYEQGITGGTSATNFSPDQTCTRGQMATFLWRNAGSQAPVSSANQFADVPADKYYAVAVQWAYEQKITSGTSATTFSPDADCTRAQMVTFLYRFFVK